MSGALGASEGKLCVRVEVENGIITAVALDSTRPVGMSAALAGRDIDAAMTLLPRLFGLCGVAQTVAGLTAAEAALGVVQAPPQIAARQLLVAAEALEQTAWRLLLDWPRGIGASPDVDAMKRLRQLSAVLRSHLFPAPDWNRIGGARLMPDWVELAATLERLEAGVRLAVCGGAAGDGWPLEDRDGFERWLRDARTPVAMTLRHVRECGLADFGRSAVAPLPVIDARAMEQRLAADDGYAYCARPDWDGVVYETGALARLWWHPLIAALRADRGNGLFTRLVARLIDSRDFVAEMREQASRLEAHPGAITPGTASGAGLGIVECARGRLVHRVAVAVGRVTDYKILAPTEWNFHPEGPLARGLAGAGVGSGTAIDQAIGLFVTALDPCVGCDLTVEKR
jgi:coenzyme F420-reducing hydrogenase alpha subunit